MIELGEVRQHLQQERGLTDHESQILLHNHASSTILDYRCLLYTFNHLSSTNALNL